MNHDRLTKANEPSYSLEDDLELQRRLGLLAVWRAPSDADLLIAQDLARELPDAQRAVIARHYGLEGHPGRSLRKVAEELHISPTHARRLERRALRRLRVTWPTPEVSL